MSVELVVVPRSDGISHVELVGRLDIVAMEAIHVRFHAETAAREQPAIVDLSRLEFITSLGIGMIFGCAKSLWRNGHTMVLICGTGFVDATLRTVGVHEVIPFATTWEEALRMVRASRS